MRRTANAKRHRWLTGQNQRFLSLVSVVLGIVLWQWAGSNLGFRFLPPFRVVFLAMLDILQEPSFWVQFAASMQSLLLGYCVAVLLGVTLGSLMGFYKSVVIALGGYVDILLSTPKLIFAPVLLSLFGVSRGSQVALIVLYALPFIIVNTSTGVRTVQQSWIDMARAFGATPQQVFVRVLIPGASPLLLTGLNVGVSRAVKGMLAGEMFIAYIGIGAELRRYGTRFDVARVWGILLFIILLSTLLLAIFDLSTRRYRLASGETDFAAR